MDHQVCPMAWADKRTARLQVSRGPKRNAAHNKEGITKTNGSDPIGLSSQPPKSTSTVSDVSRTRTQSSSVRGEVKARRGWRYQRKSAGARTSMPARSPSHHVYQTE